MYHICKLTYGKRVVYAVTDQLLPVLELVQSWGGKVESLHQAHQWEMVLAIVSALYLDSVKKRPDEIYPMLIEGRVYTDIYEIMYALEDMAPRVLGWRVRRFGARLGVLGRFLRRRRRAGRARRQERRRLRKAHREIRRKARRVRRAELWKRFRNLPLFRYVRGDYS